MHVKAGGRPRLASLHVYTCVDMHVEAGGQPRLVSLHVYTCLHACGGQKTSYIVPHARCLSFLLKTELLTGLQLPDLTRMSDEQAPEILFRPR